MDTFSERDLKQLKLVHLKQVVQDYKIKIGPGKRNKARIVESIVASKGGQGLLKKLITASREKATEKFFMNTFMETERARLIAKGATDMKKIDDEVNRLWSMQKKTCKGDVCVLKTNKPLKTIAKTKSVKVKASLKKRSPAKKQDTNDDDSDDEFEEAVAEIEERAISRVMSKKIKREHINGFLAGFGVDASVLSLAHAKEEVVVQLLNETDDENSDDEEEDKEDEEGEDEEDEEEVEVEAEEEVEAEAEDEDEEDEDEDEEDEDEEDEDEDEDE